MAESEPNESEERTRELTPDELLAVNGVCNQYEKNWKQWRATEDSDSTSWPKVESMLESVPGELRHGAIRELVAIEMEYRFQSGQTLRLTEFTRRFPEIDSGWFISLLQDSVSDVEQPLTQTSPAYGLDSHANDFELSQSSGAEFQQVGQYEIIGKLGSGGMGTVYQAVHREMQRDVALKMMRREIAAHESSRRRFRREVLATAKLIHPNIVTAYDAGEFEGRPFLVSELVDGVDLRSLVRQKGALPWRQAAQYALDAAKGLAYAHDHQITHRDISPANLLLSRCDNVVKVLDLGLARLSAGTESDREAGELTHSNAVMGTASYMAPEQARSTKNADARSDIYSLGCVMYFLLEGKPPFRGESMVDTLIAHATEPIPRLVQATDRESVPPGFIRLLDRMLAKSPERRPQTMGEIVDELAGLLEPEAPGRRSSESAIVLPPAPPVIRHVRRTNPKEVSPSMGSDPRWRLGLVAAMLGAIILLIWAFYPWGDQRSSHASSEPDRPRENRAMLFDGVSSYVQVPGIQAGPGDQVTMEAWIRVDRSRVANAISWTGGNWMALFHSGQWGISRLQAGRSLFFRSRDQHDPDDGNWHHIAGTWDGESLNLFIDGRSVRRGNLDFDLGATAPGLFIGGAPVSVLPRGQEDRFFQGAIDAIRIVRGVVYPAGQEFEPPRQLVPVPNTLVLFQFDEPDGSGQVLGFVRKRKSWGCCQRGIGVSFTSVGGLSWISVSIPEVTCARSFL